MQYTIYTQIYILYNGNKYIYILYRYNRVICVLPTVHIQNIFKYIQTINGYYISIYSLKSKFYVLKKKPI